MLSSVAVPCAAYSPNSALWLAECRALPPLWTAVGWAADSTLE